MSDRKQPQHEAIISGERVALAALGAKLLAA